MSTPLSPEERAAVASPCKTDRTPPCAEREPRSRCGNCQIRPTVAQQIREAEESAVADALEPGFTGDELFKALGGEHRVNEAVAQERARVLRIVEGMLYTGTTEAWKRMLRAAIESGTEEL